MGVAELLAAFNSVTEPRGYVARKATLGYGQQSGAEMQILTFYGIDPAGVVFQTNSDPLRASTDVLVAARGVAQAFLNSKESSP